MPGRTLFLLLASALAFAPAQAGVSAAETARLLQQTGFDPHSCYRVHDLEISREDLRIYLTSGYLLLAGKVNGVRPAALFTTDVEAGDAEVLLIPPNRSERLSLASFIDAPNLDEHFRSALMLFTDGTGAELETRIAEKEKDAGRSWRDESRGAELAAQFTPALHNIYASFDTRLVQGLLSPGPKGLFFATIAGQRLQNVDLEYEPVPQPHIVLGQLKSQDARTWFDTWASFPARSTRLAKKTAASPPVAMEDFRIDAALDANLRVSAVTHARVTVTAGNERAVPFLIATGMHIRSARIDGQTAEVFESESLRSTLIRGGPDTVFLVIPQAPLETGRAYNFEFDHEGDVVSPAGNGIFFVGARGSWYPHEDSGFAGFDITYRWPSSLDLVSTGDLVESHSEGDVKVARFRTAAPIRLAGFNLGTYEHRTLDRDGFHVEVCANKTTEPSMTAKEAAPRLDAVAEEVSAALGFMTAQFGTPPIRSVTVSPIPGRFGQGFPGLIYLSTLTYMRPADRPASLRDKYTEMLLSDLMVAHETAHQWWGNVVGPASADDDWLPEALANYSALMFLQKRDGGRALDAVLDEYRGELMARRSGGRPVDAAGPISWGTRLSTSQNPDAWRIITYEKGSWIIHMLRRRLGDENFLAFLRETCHRYRFQSMSTEDFRLLAAQFLPPKAPDPKLESFFDTWVYGTGIPSLKLRYAVSGTRISGTIAQNAVPEDFSALVPVVIVSAEGKARTEWVETGSDPVSFSYSISGRPIRAFLQAEDALVTIQE